MSSFQSPAEELASLERNGLRRRLRPLETPTHPRVIREGKVLWNFASNDYLGLCDSEELRQAFLEGIARYGHGAGASRLITGTQPPHLRFEEELAAAKGSESALLFSSGYATAVGVVPAIVGKGDFVILDKLCHASLIDGARLSGATLRVFPHNEVGKLKHLLQSIRAKHPKTRILILTESVFSMDGDLAPLDQLVALKNEHDALLLLDEAHGFGVLGPKGMGLAEARHLQADIDFQMGTLSKAAALSGAYLACTRDWHDLLVNKARSFIFSTAPPPALAHACSTSLALLRGETGSKLRRALRERVELLAPGHPSPIYPHQCGSSESALQASTRLEDLGFLVPAIRYPTVPHGTARLRISLGANHPTEQVVDLQAALNSLT
ncbi:MAG: aminotransferase class I/II-fold pyridoxal phosphate-dependent enzyme [Verrucomicrobiales bacterium]